MGPIEKNIDSKIRTGFSVLQMELENESHSHSVPKNSETHFRLLLVSDDFNGLSRVQRQRKVFDLLAHEMKNGVHALTMRLLTEAEWQTEVARGTEFTSPVCHSKTKK